MHIAAFLAFAAVSNVSPAATHAATHRPTEPRNAACVAMRDLRLPDVRITQAAVVDATPTGQVRAKHCRVSGIIGREIRFLVLLPEEWNQLFMMGGGGGFAGSLQNQAQGSVNDGFASASTDTGHDAPGTVGGWALNNLERQLNYGHLAIHRTAEVAKAIVRAHYGSDARHSFFYGCSNGGREALMEAQRYPGDFDGIVSGAPSLALSRGLAFRLQNVQSAFPNPHDLSTPLVTQDNLRLLESKILEACDALDGVKDGVMEDPRACNFRLATIKSCAPNRAAADCLTKAQRSAIERIYAPTQIAGTGIFPGQPFGGEAAPGGWRPWLTGVAEPLLAVTNGYAPSYHFAFATEFSKYFVFGDSAWDYRHYDLSNWPRDTRLLATFLNAEDANLDAFKARGGKLILFHGWSDPALNALSTIGYAERVRARDPGSSAYLRLFMLPGVLHCGGGAGPDRVDWFSLIAAWVEHDTFPDRVLATKRDSTGKVVRTRPLCPYPRRAVYLGGGSTDSASSFSCRES